MNYAVWTVEMLPWALEGVTSNEGPATPNRLARHTCMRRTGELLTSMEVH